MFVNDASVSILTFGYITKSLSKKPSLWVVDCPLRVSKWFTSPWFCWLYRAGVLCWIFEVRHLKQALQIILRTWLWQHGEVWYFPWLRSVHSYWWALDTWSQRATLCYRVIQVQVSHKFHMSCNTQCPSHFWKGTRAEMGDMNHRFCMLCEHALPIHGVCFGHMPGSSSGHAYSCVTQTLHQIKGFCSCDRRWLLDMGWNLSEKYLLRICFRLVQFATTNTPVLLNVQIPDQIFNKSRVLWCLL